jgi:RimJ/RimL family protein N-acetyltransferase
LAQKCVSGLKTSFQEGFGPYNLFKKHALSPNVSFELSYFTDYQINGELFMTSLETERLLICPLSVDDGAFIVDLLNDPGWLRFIGDKGVRTVAEARVYLVNGPLASYEQFGFGLCLVKLKAENRAIGVCGLIKREGLADVDLGFAFLPQFRGQGYAFEAAQAVLHYGQTELGLARIVAITLPENKASIRLLEKLGLRFEKTIKLPGDEETLHLFGIEL